MSRRTSFRTQAPREGTLIVAAIPWAVGFADVILGAIQLGDDYGLRGVAAAGSCSSSALSSTQP